MRDIIEEVVVRMDIRALIGLSLMVSEASPSLGVLFNLRCSPPTGVLGNLLL
jgi:hypothetical protein